jgi:hypothetical protein
MPTPHRPAGFARICFSAFLFSAAGAMARAQITEVPETVKPGKFLLEIDAITFDQDRTGHGKYSLLGMATTLVTAGLTPSVDLQACFQFFARSTYQDRAFRDTRTGLGDLSVRMKWTFWRGGESGAAAAAIPYVKLPTNTDGIGNNAMEGGIIFPWGMVLPGEILVGAMTQWDVVRNADDDGYDSRWSASAYAHRSLSRKIGLYGEATTGVSSDTRSTFAGSIGGGVTLTVAENVMWDYEISRGVGGRATDWKHAVRLNWGF